MSLSRVAYGPSVAAPSVATSRDTSPGTGEGI
jgi:hypothetical protein